jgi:hypothetical protein
MQFGALSTESLDRRGLQASFTPSKSSRSLAPSYSSRFPRQQQEPSAMSNYAYRFVGQEGLPKTLTAFDLDQFFQSS